MNVISVAKTRLYSYHKIDTKTTVCPINLIPILSKSIAAAIPYDISQYHDLLFQLHLIAEVSRH